MPYYVFDDAKNKFEGMTREQIINAIASATGLTPAQIDDDIITTAIKEQNAQRSVNLWVGTQAEYNAIPQPDENTLYVVTDPNETTELQNEIDRLQAEVDRLKIGGAEIWKYTDTGATTPGLNNGFLENVSALSVPITNYSAVVVTLGAYDAENAGKLKDLISVLCTQYPESYEQTDKAAFFCGSNYDLNENFIASVKLHVYRNSDVNFPTIIDGRQYATDIVEATKIDDPFSMNTIYTNLRVISVHGIM